MSIETEKEVEGLSGESPTPAKKKTAANSKNSARSKIRKAVPRLARSSGAKPSGEKLICRYCGSDDLAPSFRKRRDTRCRACFKNRYSAAARGQKAVRTRKVKAAK